MSLKRSACHPNERFLVLVNACLDPLRVCWEGKVTDGYKVVKLHDMLREPWVGDHTVDLAEGWQTFWTEVEELKEQSRGVSKENRRRELEEVLAPMRKPCADGRRWLLGDESGALSLLVLHAAVAPPGIAAGPPVVAALQLQPLGRLQPPQL